MWYVLYFIFNSFVTRLENSCCDSVLDDVTNKIARYPSPHLDTKCYFEAMSSREFSIVSPVNFHMRNN